MNEVAQIAKEIEESSGSRVNIIILPPTNGDVSIDQVVKSLMESNTVSLPKPVRSNGNGGSFEPVLINRVKDIDWSQLTDRETAVFHLMVEGNENKEIAEHLGISEKTVKNHVSSILLKMKVKNRTQAVVLAFQTAYAQIV